MYRKGKIFAFFSICFVLVTGIFAQSSFIASTVPSSGGSDNESPKTSAPTFYDLGGPSMTIDSDPSGSNPNETVSILDNGASKSNITSDIKEGNSGAGYSGQAQATVNDTLDIKSTPDNKTTLTKLDGGVNATIDNGFNPHAVGVEAWGSDAQNSDIQADAKGNTTTNKMDQFQLYELGTKPWYVDYNWNNSKGERRLDWFGLGGPWGIIQLSSWLIIMLGSAQYNISTGTGEIFNATGDSIGFIGGGALDTGGAITLVTDNDTIVITDSIWEIVIVWAIVWDITIYHLVQAFILVWAYDTIIVYWDVWIYIFYLIIVTELLYVIIVYELKIEYYYTYIVIVWYDIMITITYMITWIHWCICYGWSWWFVKVQWWFFFDIIWIFIDLIIWIEYR